MQISEWKWQPKILFKRLSAAMVSLPCLHRPLQGRVMLNFSPAPQPVSAKHQFQKLVSGGHIPPHLPPNPLDPDTKPGSNIINCLCTDFCKCQHRMVFVVWLFVLLWFVGIFSLSWPKGLFYFYFYVHVYVYFIILLVLLLFFSHLWLYQW